MTLGLAHVLQRVSIRSATTLQFPRLHPATMLTLSPFRSVQTMSSVFSPALPTHALPLARLMKFVISTLTASLAFVSMDFVTEATHLLRVLLRSNARVATSVLNLQVPVLLKESWEALVH